MNNIESKNFLFYSNYCDYCIDVLNVLKNLNMENNINIVCIDNQGKLPQVVDRVPMIITSNNKVIADDDVVTFITEMYNGTLESVAALMHDTSSAFSFIDEDEELNEIQMRHFEFIQDENIEVGRQTQEDLKSISNVETQTTRKMDKSVLENYMNQRELDERMFSQQQPVTY